MLIVTGTISFDPGHHEEAAAAALEMMAETNKEAGCLAYHFTADLAKPGVLHIYEKWESQEALDAHGTQPHMARFRATIGKFGRRDVAVRKYEIASEGPVF
jgi:quinol monooxygenase YgiN